MLEEEKVEDLFGKVIEQKIAQIKPIYDLINKSKNLKGRNVKTKKLLDISEKILDSLMMLVYENIQLVTTVTALQRQNLATETGFQVLVEFLQEQDCLEVDDLVEELNTRAETRFKQMMPNLEQEEKPVKTVEEVVAEEELADE